jgi:trehalose 6-phosphate phosphatase
MHNLLTTVAQTPVLLIGCDYDGTLAPIVDDPAQAWPILASIRALERLVELPNTHVAVISGRSVSDLKSFTRLSSRVWLVGSHGAEFPRAEPATSDVGAQPEPVDRKLAAAIAGSLDVIAARFAGCRVEPKPVGAALHVRQVAPSLRAECMQDVLDGPGAWPEVVVKHGKMVVDLCARSADKGVALDAIRATVGATKVVFIGDDLTDEDAFARLIQPRDLGVKVGPGATAALCRVESPRQVTSVLAMLHAARRSYQASFTDEM